MLLYVVHDNSAQTYSQPLISDSMETVKSAFIELNPENLSNLILIPLYIFDSIPDLIQSIQSSYYNDTGLKLAATTPRSAEVTPSATPQPKGVSSSNED